MKKLTFLLIILGMFVTTPLIKTAYAGVYWNVGLTWYPGLFYSPYRYGISSYYRYNLQSTLADFRYHRQMLEKLTILGEAKKEAWLKTEQYPLVTSVRPETDTPETLLDLPQIKTVEPHEL